MNFTFLISTAFAVSIDSFFAGISLTFGETKKLSTLISTTSVIFLMCLFGNLLGSILAVSASDKYTLLGGAILAGVGLYNLFSKEKSDPRLKPPKNSFSENCLIGFGVGVDGCVADLSLAVMGYSAFYVPLTVTFMHFVLIWLGLVLAEKLKHFTSGIMAVLPSAVLIALGLYKVASVI